MGCLLYKYILLPFFSYIALFHLIGRMNFQISGFRPQFTKRHYMMLSLLCVCVFIYGCECVHERVLWVHLGLLLSSFRHRKITTIFYAISVTIFYNLCFCSKTLQQVTPQSILYVIETVFW
jgi:hypothetical protein